MKSLVTRAKRYLPKILVGLEILSMVVACSKADFSARQSVGQKCVGVDASTNCVVTCYGGKCEKSFDYTRQADQVPSDILFVVDNSGSMTAEQEAMATKFPNFLNRISTFDYRIAVTTTDISGSRNGPAAPNGFGRLQDGRLIEFTSGRYFLDGTLASNIEQDLFLNTVRRQESLNCKASGHQAGQCPSGDERGILAAHMAVQNNNYGFIRNSGKLDVIVLSDEDERSDGGFIDPLAPEEEPDNFVANVKMMFPNKSLKFHSIIIQPGDSSCFNQQANSGSPAGTYGNVYWELTELTQGVQGSICASDYGQLLGGIGESVAQLREALPCRPLNDEITVSFSPQPTDAIDVIKDLDRLEISFSKALPAGTKVRFEYRCE